MNLRIRGLGRVSGLPGVLDAPALFGHATRQRISQDTEAPRDLELCRISDEGPPMRKPVDAPRASAALVYSVLKPSFV